MKAQFSKHIQQLLDLIELKSLDNPTCGWEPPNIRTLMANVSWALEHPGSYTEPYLNNLKNQIEEGEYGLSMLRMILSARLPGHKRTIMEERMSRRRKG